MTTAKRAVAIVTAAGGYTSAENAVARSATSGGTVSLTLKIPVPVYQQVLAELSSPSLGKQVSLTQQATDVTQQVADVNSLVRSEQAAITALQGLLRHAANISQLLDVQQQISTDESSLESLQAQQRALNHETSYATVNMTLLSVVHRAPPRTRHAGGGFVSGLAAGWRALRHATALVLTALGATLPFLIIAAILAGLGYAGRRRIVRRRAGPTAAGCSQAPCSCTSSVSRTSMSGSVCGRTPWPRLKMCPSAVRPRCSTCSGPRPITSQGASRTAGSRLPCSALPSSTRRAASSSGTRQSTPTTSAPASPITPSSSPVPTPKWILGTPAPASASKIRLLCGSTETR